MRILTSILNLIYWLYFIHMKNAAHFLSNTSEPCCERWYPSKDDCPITNSTTTPKQLDYKPDPSEGYYYPHLDGSNCR